MRLLAASLLIINLAYFIWHLEGPKTPEIEIIGNSDALPIRLLSEVEDDLRKRVLDEVVTRPVLPGRKDASDCDALGPFEDVLQGQVVMERLEALDFPVSLRAIDEPTGDNDFRIMIPPVASLEEAFRKLRELQSQDIDSYVITKGKDALSISLGVYSTLGAAESAQRTHRNDGYETTVDKIQRLDRNYWIIPQSSYGFAVSEVVMRDLKTEFAHISIVTNVCPGPES